MKQQLLCFAFLSLLCGCTSRKTTDNQTESICDYEETSKSLYETDKVWRDIGLRIYPTTEDYELWQKSRTIDICLKMHDTLVVYKYNHPVVEGLPVELYTDYVKDSLQKKMSNMGWTLYEDIDDMRCEKNSTNIYFEIYDNVAVFSHIKAKSHDFSFDSIRVGDSIKNMNLFADLWRLNRIDTPINVIEIHSTFFIDSRTWKNSMVEKIHVSERDFFLQFEIEDGLVRDCYFGVSL